MVQVMLAKLKMNLSSWLLTKIILLVKSLARYFSVEKPKKANADGLIACLQESRKLLALVMCSAKLVFWDANPFLLVGVLTEPQRMKGKIQQELPWLFWAWCYAYRLELACKDVFTSQLFTSITDMQLRLYYLYSKSPKKLRELSDIVCDLGKVFELPKGGDAPIHSQGSCWISHKHQALQQVIECYGAYTSHPSWQIALSTVQI